MIAADTEHILDSWTAVLDAVRSSQSLTFSIRRLCLLRTQDRLAAVSRLAESMLANGEDKDLVAFVRTLRDPRMCRAVLDVVPPIPISLAGQNRLLWIFFGGSILLHVLLLLLIFSGIIANLKIPDLKEKPSKITLTLIPKRIIPEPPPQQPPATPFLDTSGLPTLATPDPKAAFEGETNTAAMSRVTGQGNPSLPNQQGDTRPGLEFFNSKYSPEQVTPLSPPPTPETPTKTNPAPEPAEATPLKQGLKEPLRTNPSARIQTGESEKEPREAPREARKPEQPQSQPPTPQKTTEPTTSPASFSAYKRENRIEGGAPRGDVNSAAARESEIGRYKAKLYRAIGSRWYAYIHQDSGTISLGVVRLRFYVRHDGVILPPEVVDGNQHSALLAVSRRSVMEVSGQLEPFSESMRQQLGEGYYEEVSFSIY